MSIVQALLEQVEEEVARSGYAGRVVAVHLVVGRLSGVHTDAIRFAFELLSPDSIAQHAHLHVEEPRASCRCRQCGAVQEITDIVSGCPSCGHGDIIIQGGQELLLQSIELEDTEEAGPNAPAEGARREDSRREEDPQGQ
jgi:hydrogenase nickel incorporation protein HypA/HybF